jgi:hypothetical protein
VGDSSNIVACGIYARAAERIAFGRFLKLGLPISLAQLLAAAYIAAIGRTGWGRGSANALIRASGHQTASGGAAHDRTRTLPGHARNVASGGGGRRGAVFRRARVRPFVDQHFSLLGSAAIHRAALGWDILRAPANILLAGRMPG